MQFFHELGSLVEQRWRDVNYDEGVFPEIAAEALSETMPSSRVNPWDIIRWLNTTTELPEQQDVPGTFGNPPITLFNGQRFYIDVYYWLDGTTSIHQHAFCGAFQVLQGSSILSEYGFEEKRRINSHFSAGEIILDKVELLEQGDIRQILPGGQYIHSLFHLDRPSATVIIRTRYGPSHSPQYNYLKPFFAVDPFFRSAAIIKKVQSAALLLSMKYPQADELIGELLSCSDFQTAFAILELASNQLANDQMERAFGISTGQQRFQAYIETARRRHGELVDLILPVFDEFRRQHNLIQRRGQITASEHRFFLALLLNVPDRRKLLDLVRQRFPDRDPVGTVTGWVDDLANTKVLGSTEANVLGIDNFDEDYVFVFQSLFEGLTIDQMKSAFIEETSVEDAEKLGAKLEGLYHTIKISLPFKSIFPDSSKTAQAWSTGGNLKLASSRGPG
jgi:hypothetical protein